MLQNSTIQTTVSAEQNIGGYDVFSDDDNCSCSTVYSVGDISSITGASNDVACIDDVQECDYEYEESDDAEELTVNTSINQSGIAQEQVLSTTPISPGYVLVIDNIDLNVRRSNQRIGQTTNSYHFCHGYALQNRVDSTGLPDGMPSGVLSPDVVLPNKEDLESILSDFAVLVSR